MEKKKWYQSKIIIFAGGTIVALGSNLIWNWAGTQLTPDEIQYIQANAPDAGAKVKEAIENNNVLASLGVIGNFFIGWWRLQTSRPIM